MMKGLTTSDPIIAHAEMEGYVARFQNRQGSEDIQELRPNILPPALGFNHGMIPCDVGNGASLHSLTAQEVFIPLIGPWAVTWPNGAEEQEINLQPSDCIHDPAGLHRGFRHVCEGRGTLLTLISGPDTGQVSQEPGVLARAAAQGLFRVSGGEVEGFGS